MHPLLSIKNLSIDFVSGREITNAVNNISFTINKDEILALVGESGSGKSVTALSILQLLVSPPARYSSGNILFSTDGHLQVDLLQAGQKNLQDIRGNKISMIFQEPMTSLNPVLTCGDQVMEAIRSHKKVTPSQAKLQTLEWFRKVKLTDAALIFNRYPHQLSGGQKQRVVIAMAMCCHPSLLICDEPTTALDVTVQKDILHLIKELQQYQNMGVIFITHDFAVVAEIADRAIVMYKGEIVEQNTTAQILKNPQHPYTKALLSCRPANHKRGERLPVVSDFLFSTPGGPQTKLIDPSFQSALADYGPSSGVLVSVQNLSVHFATKRSLLGKPLEFIRAVDEVSFDVYKGETLGLVGESGCGKTTLGRTLLRLIEPYEGKIIYNGMDLTKKKTDELKKLRKDIQIIFQDPYSSLNPRITIGDAIAEPMKVHRIATSTPQQRNKVTELLDKVSLGKEYYNRYPHEISGGQRQRVVIARALALNPSFIVCDESVSALDVSVQAQVLNLLNDLKREFGFTIIFISHDLSVVRYISNRIMVMHKGKIVETGEADAVYFDPQTDYSKKLIASIPKGLKQ